MEEFCSVYLPRFNQRGRTIKKFIHACFKGSHNCGNGLSSLSKAIVFMANTVQIPEGRVEKKRGHKVRESKAQLELYRAGSGSKKERLKVVCSYCFWH